MNVLLKSNSLRKANPFQRHGGSAKHWHQPLTFLPGIPSWWILLSGWLPFRKTKAWSRKQYAQSHMQGKSRTRKQSFWFLNWRSSQFSKLGVTALAQNGFGLFFFFFNNSTQVSRTRNWECPKESVCGSTWQWQDRNEAECTKVTTKGWVPGIWI